MLRLLVLVLIAICMMQRSAIADDTADKCQALRNLDAEFKGRSLTLTQKAIKIQLVAWYRANCGSLGRRAKAKP